MSESAYFDSYQTGNITNNILPGISNGYRGDTSTENTFGKCYENHHNRRNVQKLLYLNGKYFHSF